MSKLIMTGMTVSQQMDLAMSKLLKVGDTVLNWGDNEMTVKKVNKKTIVTPSPAPGYPDTVWKYSEISLPKSRMPELVAMVKKIREEGI